MLTVSCDDHKHKGPRTALPHTPGRTAPITPSDPTSPVVETYVCNVRILGEKGALVWCDRRGAEQPRAAEDTDPTATAFSRDDSIRRSVSNNRKVRECAHVRWCTCMCVCSVVCTRMGVRLCAVLHAARTLLFQCICTWVPMVRTRVLMAAHQKLWRHACYC